MYGITFVVSFSCSTGANMFLGMDLLNIAPGFAVLIVGAVIVGISLVACELLMHYRPGSRIQLAVVGVMGVILFVLAIALLALIADRTN
jgi:hypothetical protein